VRWQWLVPKKVCQYHHHHNSNHNIGNNINDKDLQMIGEE